MDTIIKQFGNSDQSSSRRGFAMISDDQVKAFLGDALEMIYDDIERDINKRLRGERAEYLISSIKAIVDYRIGLDSDNLEKFLAEPGK